MCKFDKEIEALVIRLISNTRRKNRPDNLVVIARDIIRQLENKLGSLKAISEFPGVGISVDMLKQFLSVEMLCPEVKKLVEERKIDLINVVHYMRNFDPEAQKAIAREVIEGRLSANDIRVLAPFRKASPDLDIAQLISHIQKMRNIKIYVAYFIIPSELKEIQSLRERFEEIVGKDEIISFAVEDSIGRLELTSIGQKKLRQMAKEQRLSLRKFVDSIIRKL
jgi:hypothetical protein